MFNNKFKNLALTSGITNKNGENVFMRSRLYAQFRQESYSKPNIMYGALNLSDTIWSTNMSMNSSVTSKHDKIGLCIQDWFAQLFLNEP